MAYNNGFPMGYNYYQQPMMQQQQPAYGQQQMIQQQIPQQMQQNQMQQIQQPVQQYPIVQGGFVRVMNENEARMYPVAPASSVTFIDESKPYVYTKTINMGQLDRPVFERFRLVKEDDNGNAPQQPVERPQKPVESPQIDVGQFVTQDDIAAFRADLESIRTDIETIRTDMYGIAGKKKSIKKEAEQND